MSAKKKGSKTAMLRNLLTTGSIEKNIVTEEVIIDDVVDVENAPIDENIDLEHTDNMDEDQVDDEFIVTSHNKVLEKSICNDDIADLKKEVFDLKKQIFALRTENQNYLTSKELHKSYLDIINGRDNELTNKKMMSMLEQLSAMREDFFKLCKDMECKLDKFSSKDVLNSFEAYSTDMENILVDAGVFIGKFNYEKLNTVHQRIIDVIPTDDESNDGMVAERVSEGYEFNGHVLFKEKVKIYKFTEKGKVESEKEE